MSTRAFRALRFAESLALLAVGSAMAGLAVSDRYWQLLNPKFAPLTLAAGCCLLVVGTVHGFAPGTGRARRSSLLAMVAFLALFGLSWQPQRTASTDSLFAGDATYAEDGGSRLEYEGAEYVKINTVELWMQSDLGLQDGATAQEQPPDLGTQGRVALRGQVRTLPAEPGDGERYALVRIAVSCCFADAVASGFVVEAALPEGITDGDWVVLLARVVPLSGTAPQPGVISTPGVTLTALHERVALAPVRVSREPAPQPAFLFEFRAAEPYAW